MDTDVSKSNGPTHSLNEPSRQAHGTSAPWMPIQRTEISSTRSSSPIEPSESAAMCHSSRSKASPRAVRASALPASQARSPSL